MKVTAKKKSAVKKTAKRKTAASKKVATKTAASKKAKRTTATPRKKKVTLSLNDVIVKSISDKKGENITTIDLRKIHDTAANFFIICEAESTTQVKAIADNVAEQTRIALNDKPWHVEGMQKLDWVLLDYVNTVVHVFRKPIREFYELEDLWNDGDVTEHND